MRTRPHHAGLTTLTSAERERLEPLAAAIHRARRPGPARLEVVAGDPAFTRTARVGLLAGTFNPLTLAHTALAEAAAAAGCDRVVLAMAPTSIGKEQVERAHPLDRLDWVAAWARAKPWTVAAVSSHPLLVDMAEAAGVRGAQVALIVGTDKAAQLVDPVYYDDPEAALERLRRACSLLVATRDGHPEPHLPFPSAPLPTPAWVPARSSTQTRAEAAARGTLSGHVPAELVAAIEVSRAYAPDPQAYAARAAALERLLQDDAGGSSEGGSGLSRQGG